MSNVTEFIAMYKDCPWMVTAFDFAKTCNQALQVGDYAGLEELSRFGKKHGPFSDDTQKSVAATDLGRPRKKRVEQREQRRRDGHKLWCWYCRAPIYDDEDFREYDIADSRGVIRSGVHTSCPPNQKGDSPGRAGYAGEGIIMKNTPGPWAFGMPSGQIYSRVTGRHICTMNINGMDTAPEWTRADARLIAATPELLEACKSALDIINSYSQIPAMFQACQTLQTAIAQAEGRK